jgi:hypothetical protein
MGLSIPKWSLMAFVGLGVVNVWQLLRSVKSGAK